MSEGTDQTNCRCCGRAFDPPRKNPARQTCSRSCATRVGWKTNGDRGAAVSAGQRRRSGDIVASNHRRWAKSGERDNLRARNRAMWANPEMRRRLTDSIRSRKASPESRRRMSEIRQRMWQDPEYRSRMLAIVAENSRKPEVRAKLSELLRERFKDPKWRAKWLASIRKDRATSETPAQKTEVPSDLPASQPYEPPVSTLRRLEEDAIAAFLASRGATQVPAVGSLELLKLVDTAPLVYDKQTRKAARRPVVAAT